MARALGEEERARASPERPCDACGELVEPVGASAFERGARVGQMSRPRDQRLLLALARARPARQRHRLLHTRSCACPSTRPCMRPSPRSRPRRSPATLLRPAITPGRDDGSPAQTLRRAQGRPLRPRWPQVLRSDRGPAPRSRSDRTSPAPKTSRLRPERPALGGSRTTRRQCGPPAKTATMPIPRQTTIAVKTVTRKQGSCQLCWRETCRSDLRRYASESEKSKGQDLTLSDRPDPIGSAPHP
jgi:hypothetical protein